MIQFSLQLTSCFAFVQLIFPVILLWDTSMFLKVISVSQTELLFPSVIRWSVAQGEREMDFLEWEVFIHLCNLVIQERCGCLDSLLYVVVCGSFSLNFTRTSPFNSHFSETVNPSRAKGWGSTHVQVLWRAYCIIILPFYFFPAPFLYIFFIYFYRTFFSLLICVLFYYPVWLMTSVWYF